MTVLPFLADSAAIPDDSLFDQICRGSEAAFNALVDRYHSAMIRVARAYVSSTALAEEAAQEAWLAVLKGYQRFERRSSVKTWIFRIVINRAVTHAAKERRGKNFEIFDESSVDAARFYADGHPLAGSWAIPPRSWNPEEQLLAGEVKRHIEMEIARLPLLQRQVITLRDVYGWSAREVCDLYSISDANQRIVLHRARAKVRQSLEKFFNGEEGSPCLPM